MRVAHREGAPVCVANGVPVPMSLAVADDVSVEEQVRESATVPVGHSEGQPHVIGQAAPVGQKLPDGHCTCVEIEEPRGQ